MGMGGESFSPLRFGEGPGEGSEDALQRAGRPLYKIGLTRMGRDLPRAPHHFVADWKGQLGKTLRRLHEP